jgi:TM2 domain-containing membrane protein YozV
MNGEKQISGNFFDYFNARNIVFVAMLVVGTLCIFMSSRNTASYLMLTGMDVGIAIMTGIALIVFSATSFTAAQLFLEQKGAAKLFSMFFVVVGITVITFSIFATLSLNYVKFLGSDVIQADIADKIEKRRSEIIAAYNAEEDKTEGQDVNQWAMQNMDRLLTLAETQGSSWNNSMRTVMETAQMMNTTEIQKQQSIDDLLATIYIESIPRTFFGFMLNLNTLDKKYFYDFFMIATPAVFYDLIAPLAVTVVLFLIGYTRRERPQTKPEASKPTERQPRREKPAVPTVSPAPTAPPQPPGLEELKIYIESAMQDDFSLLPDDAIGNIEERQCKKFREFLTSYTYKDKPIITEKEGRFVSIFDRKNLKRFIELQYNTQRKGGT